MAALVAALSAALALAGPAQASPAPPDAEPEAVIRGGDPIYPQGNGQFRCSAGFNASRGDQGYLITGGSCALGERVWYADPDRTIPIGVSEGSIGPSGYGVIRYTNPDVAHPSEVGLDDGRSITITGAVPPETTMEICRMGSATRMHCGVISAIDQTVNTSQGVFTGLFRSTVCGEPGDSGGPAFAGNKAVGVLFGGSGSCSTGGTTWHSPVMDALWEHGLTIP
ncbi:trypsin-like serine protease [Streptomyces sp. SB3404]|uniref:Trypsin-like serine protease n=1 Tax=Streptomyces boncukensis TaxID=2711219 RepID=A0A6G4XB00_9ACTN|nr:trypsin-like serine protease [Streptomyces boncukensis]